MKVKKPQPGTSLTPERRLSEKFSQIAKTKVEIYRDWSGENLLLLKWKGLRGGGKFWLPHGNSSASIKLVREHFGRLRSGNQGYDEAWDAKREQQESDERDRDRREEEFAEDCAIDAVKFGINRAVSFVSPGFGGNKK